jgi:hypothetical protein
MDAKWVRDFGGGTATWARKQRLGQESSDLGKKAATWARKLGLGEKSLARVLGPLAKSGFIVI